MTEQRIFHETYGNISPKMLRAIKKYNLSTADYDHIIDLFDLHWGIIEDEEFDMMIEHIRNNLVDDCYYPPLFR